MNISRSDKNKAVSFIELSMAIIIISILVVFLIPNVSITSKTSKALRAKGDLESIHNAILLYRVQTRGQNPPSIDALVGKYLPVIPVDPWGAPYQLDAKSYEIFFIDRDISKKVAIKYSNKN
ncbi:MAG TPA: hypothetical protein PKK26_09720 [Candidatus Wallbacteria bacterium]|nr:hypothetical protein [Candidatus Wallbacteria bacterium]